MAAQVKGFISLNGATAFAKSTCINFNFRTIGESMSVTTLHVEWALIPLFCTLTGYSRKAVERKIQDGKWIEGKHYRRAPDGHITMNLKAYYSWVQGGMA